MNPRRRSGRPKPPRARWLGRMLRGWWPDRNPLRRASDRAETAVFGLLIAAFLASAPFAAHAAGTWAYASSVREAQAQYATLRQVPATLLQRAPDWIGYVNVPGAAPQVSARWRAPDGQLRTGQVFAPNGAPAGSTVTVWTNQAGQLADAPLQHTQVLSRVNLTQAGAVAALAIIVTLAGWLVRRALNRRRMAAWEAGWLANGPRWSPRR